MDWGATVITLIIGAALGAILSFALSLLWPILQFRRSIAGYRLNAIVDATRLFLKIDHDTGAPRDKYRFSLSALIDDLAHTDDTGHRPDGSWPSLIDDTSGDRWAKFLREIR